MDPPLDDPGEGGSVYEDIRVLLHSGCPVDSDIWVGDVVCDPPHGTDPGGVPPPGCKIYNWKTPQDPSVCDQDLPAVCGGHAGSWN